MNDKLLEVYRNVRSSLDTLEWPDNVDATLSCYGLQRRWIKRGDRRDQERGSATPRVQLDMWHYITYYGIRVTIGCDFYSNIHGLGFIVRRVFDAWSSSEACKDTYLCISFVCVKEPGLVHLRLGGWYNSTWNHWRTDIVTPTSKERDFMDFLVQHTNGSQWVPLYSAWDRHVLERVTHEGHL